MFIVMTCRDTSRLPPFRQKMCDSQARLSDNLQERLPVVRRAFSLFSFYAFFPTQINNQQSVAALEIF